MECLEQKSFIYESSDLSDLQFKQLIETRARAMSRLQDENFYTDTIDLLVAVATWEKFLHTEILSIATYSYIKIMMKMKLSRMKLIRILVQGFRL